MKPVFLFGLGLLCFWQNQLFSQSILDIGIFNVPVNSNKLEVRLRSTQTVTNGVYSAGIFTVRVLANSGVTITAPIALNTPLYSYTLQAQGSDATYNYYVFGFVSIKTVTWNAATEYPIAILQFNASCGGLATFEIVNNTWTADHNGNFYQELNGLEAQNNIYQATATAPLSSGPPIISCPANQTATTDQNQCTHTHIGTDWNAIGSASCPGSTITYTLSGATSSTLGSLSGALFAKGLTTVTAKITDNAGLTASCSFTVTVTDVQSPTIAAPAPVMTVANAAACSATGVVLGTPVTADNCSVVSATNNAPASFPFGNTTIIWTVTDAAGHSATATQLVTVQSSLVASSGHFASPQICTGSATDLFFDLPGGQGPYTIVYNDGGGNTTLTNYVSGQAITVSPSGTTTYQLTQVTNALGCSFSPVNTSATLVVHPSPTLAHVLPPVVAVCAGAPVSFFADGLIPNAATTFQYLVNGQPVTASITTDASGNATFPAAAYPGGTNNILVTAVTVHGCTTATNLNTSFVINPQSAACNLSVGGKAATEAGTGLEEVAVGLVVSGPGILPFTLNNLATGTYSFLNVIPPTSNVVISPIKDDNPLNGVSTYDLVLISRHILGLDTLGSLYKMIAADATNSGSITTFDIVELRKLILGIYQKLPSSQSWRFIDASYVFPNPLNPFTVNPLPETRTVSNILTDHLQEDFVAVKIGDVNGSALANVLAPTEERHGSSLTFDVADRVVQPGEVFTLHFQAAEKVQSYQFTLGLRDLEVLNIQPGPQMSLDNFGVFADAITTSFDADQVGEFVVTFRARSGGNMHEKLEMSGAITPVEVYDNAHERQDVVLRYNQHAVTEQGFELYPNQPNPFSDRTIIRFYLPEAAETAVQVFDEMGRLRWSQSADLPKGNNAVEIDGAVLDAAGTFYYQVKTSAHIAIRKMIYTR